MYKEAKEHEAAGTVSDENIAVGTADQIERIFGPGLLIEMQQLAEIGEGYPFCHRWCYVYNLRKATGDDVKRKIHIPNKTLFAILEDIPYKVGLKKRCPFKEDD